MKTVTSATVFQDAVGMRLSATYSEINDNTGAIISDNKRIDRVITDAAARNAVTTLLGYAQDLIDIVEG